MHRESLSIAFLVIVLVVSAISPAAAVTDGELDGNGHAYVGLMVAQDADGNPITPRNAAQPRARQRRNRFRSAGTAPRAAQGEQQQPRRQQASGQGGGEQNARPKRPSSAPRQHIEAQPRSHESATFKLHAEFGVPRSKGNGGQPDPLRTSVDGIRRSNRPSGGGKRGGRSGGFGGWNG